MAKPAGVLVTAVTIAAAACSSNASSPATTLTSTVTVTIATTSAPSNPTSGAPPPTSTASTSAATTIDKDGTFRVGIDIQPRQYSTQGLRPGEYNCIWFRLSGLSGDMKKDGIDGGVANGPGYVRIEPTDAGFKTTGCQPWKKIGD